jgi:ElaB/YqjD/DUF883 family membrane-anchored ribosome-binding protein
MNNQSIEPVLIVPTAPAGTVLSNIDEPSDQNATLRMDEDATLEIVETRAQIEETRAHLTETIDAIKDRLSPATLMAEAQESAKTVAVEAVHELKEATVDKASELVGTVVEKVQDAVATTSAVIHNATDYVSEKTTPVVENVMQQLTPAVETAKNIGVTAKGATESIVDTIRQNPIPVALIAIGIGWLLAGPRRAKSVGETYRESFPEQTVGNDLLSDPTMYHAQNTSAESNGIQNVVHNATDAVTGFAGGAKEKVADVASGVREKATGLAQNAREQANSIAQTTKEKTQFTVSFVDQWVREEPLAAGAIALLVGTAIGLALPGTDKENELFGAKRDALAQKASETAQELAGKAQTVAQNVVDSAREALGTATEQVKSDFNQEVKNQGLVAAS